MSDAATTISKRTDWLLALLASIFIGFAWWSVDQLKTISETLRLTALQVAVNRENLDQLHIQVNRGEEREGANTREAIRALESRISKLEDRARGR
jgi:indole-3-glycerol phosphate synthase